MKKVNFLLFALSLIDILSGIFLVFSIKMEYIYFILLAKGLYTLTFTSISKDLLGVLMGFLDSIGGILGVLGLFQFKIIGILILLKGIYSILFSFQ